MKKLLLILCVAVNYSAIQAQGASLPYIGTTTIIPQNPGPNDNIKIVTNVTTPSQGVFVNKQQSINQAIKEINIRGCYTSGMLPATETYIDTFTIGQLAPGIYSIKQRAYISSSEFVCVKTADSNMVVLTLTVSGITTGIKENSKTSVQIFPNPAKDFLQIKNVSQNLNVEIYSSNGSLVRNEKLDLNSEISVKELPAGLYFVRFKNEHTTEVHKFVKVN